MRITMGANGRWLFAPGVTLNLNSLTTEEWNTVRRMVAGLFRKPGKRGAR
ncbi:hypothetical protein NON00_02450 [Roseomonas sp. GC11]|nr:hypothetical protein [Roseomonas sp. GC11]MCQ4158788.1 hypothetical protein [Roseomonas sp. GC11]